MRTSEGLKLKIASVDEWEGGKRSRGEGCGELTGSLVLLDGEGRQRFFHFGMESLRNLHVRCRRKEIDRDRDDGDKKWSKRTGK